MKVLITGASGYAGYYAALRLASLGHAVTGLVRDPGRPRLQMLRVGEVELLTADVGEPAAYRPALERSDVVIHTMLDKKRPKETDRALFAALETLPRRARGPRRFVYTTGCSIFGKVGVDVIDEDVEPNPEHPLAFRRDLEREALALENVETIVFRPGFMYGCDGYNSVSADWFAAAAEGDPVFRGNREKGWSWIHIWDLAEAYRLAAEAEGRHGREVFHLADARRPRSVDVMRACLDAAGHAGEIRFEGPMKGDNISTWFDQNEFITSEKARRLLGWSPRHDGVIETIGAVYRAWLAAAQLS